MGWDWKWRRGSDPAPAESLHFVGNSLVINATIFRVGGARGAVSAAKLPTVRESRQRRRVRPGSGVRTFSPAEVADLVGVDEGRILAALERGQADFFPHARRSESEGWIIPAGDVRQLLGGQLERLLTIREFSDLVGLARETVSRAISAGHLRTVGPSWLSSVRIPASEYWRFRGDKGAPVVP